MSTKVEYHFPTDIKSILERIDKIDPVKYARSRNFIDGDVPIYRLIFPVVLSA